MFTDLLHGAQQQRPSEQCGDILIRDRDGYWTYQFAVVVDDHDHGIQLVVRGDDLLASTGRQRSLARLLGWTPPRWVLHHPLIRGASGVKLSKSDGDAGVRELRRAGVSPEAVIGRAAAAIGLSDERPIAAATVHELLARGTPQGTSTSVRGVLG